METNASPAAPIPPRGLFRRIFSWKTLRRLLLTAAVLYTLAAVVMAIETWRGRRAWAAYKLEQEALGEPLEIEAFKPKPVPDDQNFATTPLLKPLLSYHYDRTPGKAHQLVWENPTGLQYVQAINHTARMPKGTNAPSMGNAIKSQTTDIPAWAGFYRGNTNYPQAAADAKPGAVVLTALSKYQAEIDEIRTASKRPFSQFDIHVQEGVDALLPQLAVLKSFSSMIRLSALAHLSLGQRGEAFEDLELCFRIANTLSTEPTLISQLVRIALLSIGTETAWEGFQQHAWTEPQLNRLQEIASKFNLLEDYQFAMRSERAFGNKLLDRLIQGGYDAASTGLVDEGSARVMKLVPIGWFYQNKLTINRMHASMVFTSVDPKKRRAFPERAEALENAFVHASITPYNMLARMLMPALAKAAAKSARGQAGLDFLQIASALEKHRLAQGAYPKSLEGLTPNQLKTIPNDLIDGKPLRYRLETHGGYTLYSIGWDAKDDDGKPVGFKKLPSISERELGDWIWTVAP